MFEELKQYKISNLTKSFEQAAEKKLLLTSISHRFDSANNSNQLVLNFEDKFRQTVSYRSLTEKKSLLAHIIQHCDPLSCVVLCRKYGIDLSNNIYEEVGRLEKVLTGQLPKDREASAKDKWSFRERYEQMKISRFIEKRDR